MKEVVECLRNEQQTDSGNVWRTFQSIFKKSLRRTFELLKINSLHPSLHFKKVGKFWSVRVGINHRALAVEDGKDYIWVWVGVHNEYERLIKDMS